MNYKLLRFLAFICVVFFNQSLQTMQIVRERGKSFGYQLAEDALSMGARKVTDKELIIRYGPKFLVRAARFGFTKNAFAKSGMSVGIEGLAGEGLSRVMPSKPAHIIGASIASYTTDNFDWNVFRTDFSEQCLRKFQEYFKNDLAQLNDLARSCGGWQTLAAFSENAFISKRIKKRIIAPIRNNYGQHTFRLFSRISSNLGIAYSVDYLKDLLSVSHLASKLPESLKSENTETFVLPVCGFLKDQACDIIVEGGFNIACGELRQRLLRSDPNKNWSINSEVAEGAESLGSIERSIQKLRNLMNTGFIKKLHNGIRSFLLNENFRDLYSPRDEALVAYQNFIYFCAGTFENSLQQFRQAGIPPKINLIDLERRLVEVQKKLKKLYVNVLEDIIARTKSGSLCDYMEFVGKEPSSVFKDIERLKNMFPKSYKELLLDNAVLFMIDCLKAELKLRLKFIKDYESSDNSASVTIVQVPVLQQEGASCGYHALKNTFEILKSVRNGATDLHDKLHNYSIVEQYFGSKGLWREYTIFLRKKSLLKSFFIMDFSFIYQYVDDLPGLVRAPWQTVTNQYIEELAHNLLSGQLVDVDLLDRLQQSNPQNFEHYFKGEPSWPRYRVETNQIDGIIQDAINKDVINRPRAVDLSGDNVDSTELELLRDEMPLFENLKNSITIVQTVEDFGIEGREDENISLVRAALHDANISDYNHAFILGNMKYEANDGHWISLVVRKEGDNRTYMIADSLNIPYSSYGDSIHRMIERLEAPLE